MINKDIADQAEAAKVAEGTKSSSGTAVPKGLNKNQSANNYSSKKVWNNN